MIETAGQIKFCLPKFNQKGWFLILGKEVTIPQHHYSDAACSRRRFGSAILTYLESGCRAIGF
jgi:hypothetical protein